jgi:transcriptional regulator GlxA family with amidase domain
MLEACLRLLRLLDAPERIPVIAPMIMREIHYYLLTGPEGEDFRLLGTAENPNNQIARAVGWLREHYRELFSLAELAAQVNMSQPSFEVGYDSPTQFNREYKRQFGEPPRRDIAKRINVKTVVVS